MSLSPLWHSTLFGWWFFAGAFWSAIVTMALTAVCLRRVLGPGNIFTEGRIMRDLGLMVFAFSVFWFYTLFAQYIVIWYADIPMETFFIALRVHYLPWAFMSWMTVCLVWAIPFVSSAGHPAQENARDSRHCGGARDGRHLVGNLRAGRALALAADDSAGVGRNSGHGRIPWRFLAMFLSRLEIGVGGRDGADRRVALMKPLARFTNRASLTGALVALVAGMAGCSPKYPMDTLSNGSDFARRIHSIYVFVNWIDFVIMLIVLAVMFLAIFWFSTRVGEPGEPSTVTSDIRLEVAWTAIPALILVFITVPTIRTIWATQPDHWPADALTVKVIAHQWWWEFQYPQYGIDTADEVHLQAGRMVHFSMQSADIIHSFWVPTLGGKRDVVPGQINSITYTPDQLGDVLRTVRRVLRRLARQHAPARVSSRPRTISTSGSSNSSRRPRRRRAARPRRARRFSPTRPARYVIRSRVSRAFPRNIPVTSRAPT